MSALKTDNCPFCGGDKHMALPPNCTKTGDYNPGDNAQPIVRCMTCYAEAMGSPWDYTKGSAVTAWNRRTDLSQAAVAAALEAAASVLQSEADAGEKLDRAYLEGFVTLEMVHGWLRRYANSIRALITPDQCTALQAAIDAAKAEARAEDAKLLTNVLAQLIHADLFIRQINGGQGNSDRTEAIIATEAALAQIGAKP